MLRCPHCGETLEVGERAWRCANGHSFDVARQGYVALDRRAARGDTAEMVAARVAFLEAGHYTPIADAIVAAAGSARAIVDLGAGPGHYLAAVLDANPSARGFALDSSRPALRRAARAHPQITAVACDIWDALPLQDGVADVVLNVFAPRNAAEMRRILTPGGTIVVVTPTARHLQELGLLRVHPEKRERLIADLGAPEHETPVEFALELEDVGPLVEMGPNAHHHERHGPANVTVSVTVTTFRG
jgi:23S rRNA (guanine745-N1)-methyltransferase